MTQDELKEIPIFAKQIDKHLERLDSFSRHAVDEGRMAYGAYDDCGRRGIVGRQGDIGATDALYI